MLLTITTTGSESEPATDLGYLLFKHPGRVQGSDLPFGRAHVFYPEATTGTCTVALLLEVDPIGLVRGRKFVGADAFSLGQYVNDRPYAASSMVAVAMSRVFKSAMTGRCEGHQELADRRLRLEIHLPALPCRGGSGLAERLFAPMGWAVDAVAVPADPQVPRWGDSRYVDLHLTGAFRLADALHHLYVLLPVLDDAKHYWVGIDEVDKLIRAGEGWLAAHPEAELITRRYLAHSRQLVASAVGRLAEIDDTTAEVLDDAVPDDQAPDDLTTATPPPDRAPSLAQLRRTAVLEVLRSAEASAVVDVGCGEGTLLGAMLIDPSFRRILGVDVSARALQVAARRLHLETMSDRQRERFSLLQSSLTYRDDRLAGFDAMVLMEVIEHVDPQRREALERSVFGHARAQTVVVTTPNVEYNVRYPDLPPGAFRHRDHRFEWTRSQFRAWADGVAKRYSYAVAFRPIGQDDDEVGPPSQLALFSRGAADAA